MVLHSSRQPADGIHGIVSAATATNPNLGPYASAPARLTAGALLASTDIGKVCKQTDTGQFWMLVAVGVWLRAAGPKSIYTDATTARTFALTDAGALGLFSNVAGAVGTIPPNASVAFGIGARLEGAAMAAGQFSFAAGAGVTLNAPDNKLGTRTQYSQIWADKIGTDTWLISGDLAAAVGAYTHPGLLVSSVTQIGLYDAAFNTLVSGNVSQLTDQGPGSRHLVQATTTKQPAFTLTDSTINNKPSFRTDGVNDELVCSTLTMGLNRYVMAVVNHRAAGSIWGGVATQADCLLSASGSNVQAYSGLFSSSTTTYPVTTWFLVEAYYKNDGTGQFHITWDNTTGTLNATGQSTGTNTDTAWALGSRQAGTFGQNDYANISIFSDKPTAPEIAALRAALISRYALPFS